MERRKFVIGLGSLAAGAAAATGTGAFSQAMLPDRHVTVEVAEGDDEGGIALIPGDTEVAYIDDTTGKFTIDLEKGMTSDASGMNPNSTYYLGGTQETLSWNNGQDGYNWEEGIPPEDFDSEDLSEAPLFSIKNQSVEERRTEITLDVDTAPSDFKMTALGYQYGEVETNGSALTVQGTGQDTGTGINLSSGHQYNVVMVLESGSESGEVSASITINSYAMRPEYNSSSQTN